MNVSWTEKQKENHEKAARILERIKDNAFNFIRKNKDIDELTARNFIVSEFEKNGLVRDKDPPIVAFHENTGEVHYFADEKRNKKLGDSGLILLDIWAKLPGKNGMFADITWMGFKGNEIPKEIRESWNFVKEARELALDFLRNELKNCRIPLGKEVDDIVRNFFKKKGVLENFKHSTGHSLGEEVHWIYPYLDKRSVVMPILKNMGYTIEPGLYFQEKYGIRSEVDFYIDDKNELIITSEIQRDIVRI